MAQLVELAGERGDLDELRRLAADGNTDAMDLLVEAAGEREDLDELRRLAASGNTDAADVLAELTDDEDDGDDDDDDEDDDTGVGRRPGRSRRRYLEQLPFAGNTALTAPPGYWAAGAASRTPPGSPVRRQAGCRPGLESRRLPSPPRPRLSGSCPDLRKASSSHEEPRSIERLERPYRTTPPSLHG